jgi:hypothetical protein
MVFELAIQTVRPGTLPTLLTALEVAVQGRRKEYGTLIGSWITEIGTLNRSVTLWSYDDAAHRERVIAALTRASGWQAYKKSIQSALVSQSFQLLIPRRRIRDKAEGNQFYELRTYDLMPDLITEYMSFMNETIEDREKRSPNIGFWTPAQGDPDKVVHLWAYRDFEHRMEARSGALTDSSWQKYLSQAQPIVRRQHSVLMVPAAFSPLK